MRILLIEPDHATAQSIELMLKAEGYNVYSTDLGEEGVDLAKIYDYDLILLELDLHDLHGLEVLRQIRVGKVQTPIMILSRGASIETKVKTFGGGADGYLEKPFHKDELIARAASIVRRSKGHAHAIIKIGPVSVDLENRIATTGRRRIHLTRTEYMLLELFSLRKDTTLTKDMIMNHLYGGMDEPGMKIIDVFICKLRKKLEAAGIPNPAKVLATVWGRGYKLVDPPAEPALA